jgi:hypothetical protein
VYLISKKDGTPEKLISEYQKIDKSSEEIVPFRPTDAENEGGRKWATTWLDQMLILSRRAYALNRGRVLSKLQFSQHFLIGLLVGLLWFRLPVDTDTVTSREGVLFFQTAWLVFSMSFDKITSCEFRLLPSLSDLSKQIPWKEL